MIIAGTFGMAVFIAIVSLIWPETWRAHAKILVTTPKMKEQLQLTPKQFDVLTYQGIMSQDSLYIEVIDTLKWYRQAIHRLLDDEYPVQRIKDHLGEKAGRLTQFQFIENTNIPLMTELLAYSAPEGEAENPLLDSRIYLLAHLSDEQIEELYEMDEDEFSDYTVFDMRKMLSSSVAIIKETNLETIYSQMIEVSAEFGTAAGSAMLANTWIGLFEHRAEQILERSVSKNIQLTRDSAAKLSIELASAELDLAKFQSEANLDQKRAETASLIVKLTGMAPIRQKVNQKEEAFDLEHQDEPFMKERLEMYDHLSFAISPYFNTALIPTRNSLLKQINASEEWLKAFPVKEGEKIQTIKSQLLDDRTELQAINKQITAITKELNTILKSIHQDEAVISQLERKIQQKRSALRELQPLLNEADLLEQPKGKSQYRDISVGRAIKPDKRVFPKRSYMVIIGAGVAFFLFCGLAFFIDIWKEVTRPESDESH